MDYIKIVPVRKPFISINWYVGSVCNYSCSYCREELYDGKKPFTNYESFLDFLDRVIEKHSDQRIRVILYGGEITLWKQFKPLLKECVKRNVSVQVVSNGARSIKWWKDVVDMIDYLIVSYHTESASEEHITNLMKIATGHVNYMFPVDNFDENIQVAKRISKNAKTCVVPKFLRIKLGSELYPYTPKQFEFFQSTIFGDEYLDQGYYKYKGLILTKPDGKKFYISNGKKIFLNKLNRWEGWRCWGGIEMLYVNYDGDIFVGQCQRGKIGNINDKSYKLPSKPFICDKKVCNCTQDIIDSKKEKA